MADSAAPVGLPADRPACAALCPDRNGHEHRRPLRRPPPERLLQRLQALSEPGKHEERGTQRMLHGWWFEQCWCAGMCIRNDFERSGSFRTPSQGKPNLPTSIVQAVTATPSCPEGTASVPPEPLALSIGRAGTGAWLQAVLFTLLAWAAVVCTGLGGTVGVASQSLANKLASSAQHLQRHGGTSLPSRAIRRDQAESTSVQQVAGESQALSWDHTAGTPPAALVGLRIDAQRVHEPPLSAAEPHLKPRKRAHPNRAPPVLA